MSTYYKYHQQYMVSKILNRQKSNDIWTTIFDNFDDKFHFLSSYWSKIIEREKKEERE